MLAVVGMSAQLHDASTLSFRVNTAVENGLAGARQRQAEQGRSSDEARSTGARTGVERRDEG